MKIILYPCTYLKSLNYIVSVFLKVLIKVLIFQILPLNESILFAPFFVNGVYLMKNSNIFVFLGYLIFSAKWFLVYKTVEF